MWEGRAGRIRTLVIIAVSLILATSATAGIVLPPGPSVINITAVNRSTVNAGIFYASLFNKRITPRSIGNSVTYCVDVSNGQTLRAGTRLCTAIYRFPFGQIVATGIVQSQLYYRISIVGGTGIYRNVGGELISRTTDLSPKAEKLHFKLFNHDGPTEPGEATP